MQKLIQFKIDYKLKETDDHVNKESDQINDDEMVTGNVHKFDMKSTGKAVNEGQYWKFMGKIWLKCQQREGVEIEIKT